MSKQSQDFNTLQSVEQLIDIDEGIDDGEGPWRGVQKIHRAFLPSIWDPIWDPHLGMETHTESKEHMMVTVHVLQGWDIMMAGKDYSPEFSPTM